MMSTALHCDLSLKTTVCFSANRKNHFYCRLFKMVLLFQVFAFLEAYYGGKSDLMRSMSRALMSFGGICL